VGDENRSGSGCGLSSCLVLSEVHVSRAHFQSLLDQLSKTKVWSRMEALVLISRRVGKGHGMSSRPTGPSINWAHDKSSVSARNQLVRIDGSGSPCGEIEISPKLAEKLPMLTFAGVLVRSTRHVREHLVRSATSRVSFQLVTTTGRRCKPRCHYHPRCGHWRHHTRIPTKPKGHP
jgi:hypothetical protein